MKEAYILLNVEDGYEENIIVQLLNNPHIKGVYKLKGIYNLIVRIKADNSEELQRIIKSEIRSIMEIRSILKLEFISSDSQ
jgi:DNA-binding Lrp family transcriptional regulator